MNNKQFLEAISPKTDEELDFWSNNFRTFSTKEKLLKALDKHGLVDESYLIVRTGDAEGRWTAIFSVDKILAFDNTSVIHVIDCGFKVI